MSLKAIQIATGVGQRPALVFGLFGLFNCPILLFIALFVWIGASQEATMTLMKAAMSDTPISSSNAYALPPRNRSSFIGMVGPMPACVLLCPTVTIRFDRLSPEN
jgi:hypothetical protein